MTDLVVIGVDPGISGAIAVVSADRFIAVHDMPVMKLGKSSRVNAAHLMSILSIWSPLTSSEASFRSHAVIERVNAMPKQGVASTFSFGHAAGVVEGVIPALGIPYQLVTPKTWKKYYGLVGSDKEASRAKAIQLYPNAPLARKKDAGRAEAILLARYVIGREES